MQKISGLLTYYGWTRPWEVEESNPGSRTTHDLRELFWDFVEANKGTRVRQDANRDAYALVLDEGATRSLEYRERGAGILVSEAGGGFGFTHVAAYLGAVMMGLNSRHVIVTVAPERFRIIADPDHMSVPEVKYQDPGNNCRVPENYVDAVCRAGKGKDCCIFLCAGAGGFECAKFSGSVAEHLVSRMVLGTMNAGRIGNCRNTGRHEEKERAR